MPTSSRRLGSALGLAVAALAMGWSSLALGQKSHVATLEDGLTLIVHEIPGARLSSFRLAVPAGARLDPDDKAGLAHMLEHVILQGSCERSGAELAREIQRAGGSYNAFTSYNDTVFHLDVPTERFSPLVEQYLSTITAPALERADLEKERGIIGTEESYFLGDEGLFGMLEAAIYPVSVRRPLIGTVASRAAIGTEDLIAFYLEHYVPAGMTAIFTGDITVAQARALVESGFRLPFPEERKPRKAGESPATELPSSQTVSGALPGIAVGYELAGASPEECAAIAAVLDLRARLDLDVREPLASAANVRCTRIRGRDFVIALVHARFLDSARLPERVGEIFAQLGIEDTAAGDLRLARDHLEARRRALLQDPVAYADALARLALEPEVGARVRALSRPVPRLDAARLGQLARQSFQRESSLVLTFR